MVRKPLFRGGCSLRLAPLIFLVHAASWTTDLLWFFAVSRDTPCRQIRGEMTPVVDRGELRVLVLPSRSSLSFYRSVGRNTFGVYALFWPGRKRAFLERRAPYAVRTEAWNTHASSSDVLNTEKKRLRQKISFLSKLGSDVLISCTHGWFVSRTNSIFWHGR